MTDAGWAERKMERRDTSEYGDAGKYVHEATVVQMLRKEHARSVRIVKKVRWAKRPIMKSHPDDVWFKGYETACNEILTALQRGRGGRG